MLQELQNLQVADFTQQGTSYAVSKDNLTIVACLNEETQQILGSKAMECICRYIKKQLNKATVFAETELATCFLIKTEMLLATVVIGKA